MGYYCELNKHEFHDRIIVELGCGPALASIGAALAGPTAIIATDGDEDSVQLARENISLNALITNECNIQCQQLLWGNQVQISNIQSLIRKLRLQIGGEVDNENHFADVVLAADVAALPYTEYYKDLVDTMKSLCNPSGFILLAYERRHVSEDNFFEIAREHFEIIRLSRSSIHPDFQSRPVHLYKLKTKTCIS